MDLASRALPGRGMEASGAIRSAAVEVVETPILEVCPLYLKLHYRVTDDLRLAGSSGGFQDSRPSANDFEEYDAGDDDDQHQQHQQPPPRSSSSRNHASSRPAAAASKPTPAPPKPVAKQPEVNLFDFDDDDDEGQQPTPPPKFSATMAAPAAAANFDGAFLSRISSSFSNRK